MRAEPQPVRNPELASQQSAPPAGTRAVVLIFFLSLAAVAVHGYHPFVEDAEIYVPGIKKLLNPALYPQNDAFFASHAGLTFFPNLIAGSVRITHLPLEWILLAWHVACILSLLFACWKLSALCFGERRAAWGSTVLVAALLTLPVAGTALYIMDQYLNTRSFSTATVIWVVYETARRKYIRAAGWFVVTALLHPLMAGFALAYAVLLVLRRHFTPAKLTAFAALMPLTFFPPVSNAYRLALERHSYFFLLRWEWYEWLGIFGPLAIFWIVGRVSRHPAAKLICDTTVLYGLLFFAAALVITIPQPMERFVELQPLRALHVVYIMLIVIAGGLLGDFAFRSNARPKKLLRVVAVAVVLAIYFGMFYAQRQLFPATAQLELPGAPTHNAWVEAFQWIGDNTPANAYFALDPDHMRLPGEDQHGFRAIAERSMLADRIKDSGAVTMFPALAEDWLEQVNAQEGWKHFGPADFARLRDRYGVDWVVIQQPGTGGLGCPYQNAAVRVCRIPPPQSESK